MSLHSIHWDMGWGSRFLCGHKRTKTQAAPGKVGLIRKSIKMGQGAAKQILMKGHLGDQRELSNKKGKCFHREHFIQWGEGGRGGRVLPFVGAVSSLLGSGKMMCVPSQLNEAVFSF